MLEKKDAEISLLTEYVRKLNMIKNAVVALSEEIGLHILHTYPCKNCLLLLFKEKIAKYLDANWFIR